MPWAPESSFSVFNLVSESKRAVVAQRVAKVVPLPSTVDVTPKVTEDVTAKATLPVEQQEPAKVITTREQSAPTPTSAFSFEVVDVLSLVWLVVALCLAVFALVCNFRLWRIIKSQRLLTEGKILDLLEDCKAEIGVQTILGVVVTDKVKSPALFGVVRPRLLLPEGMVKTLSTEELRYVFLHELAHLKRHDIYLGWLMVILQVLHWFNPLVWFAFGRMRADRELACDGLVLSTMGPDKSQAYGQTLVNLFKGFSGLQYVPGVAGVLENKSQLKRRITMIARFKKGSYRWSALAVVLLAVLGCVALTNAKGTTQPENKKPVALAKKFVQLLVKEQFSAATKNFDATMKAVLPADKLEKTWKDTTSQAGIFNRQLGIRTEKYLVYDIVLVTCEFEKGPLDVKVVYNNKRQVSGLFFLPTPQDVLKGYQESSDKKSGAKTTDEVKKEVTKEEFERIVKQAVITISTCAETDSRVVPALESLQELDDNAVVKELIKYLDSERNTIRRSAIYVLWKGNFKSIELAGANLQNLCSHEEHYTRGMAALALGANKVDSGFDALADMTLKDSDAYARRCAAYGLGLMGRAEAKPILEKALKDSDFNVRNNAEAALTMLSQQAKSKPTPENFIEEAKVINAASPKMPPKARQLKLNPSPWVDGELTWLKVNSMAGTEIGTVIRTAETVQTEGQKAWRLESYRAVLINDVYEFTQVDAELDSFSPITGRSKNELGDFTARYQPKKVELTAVADGKETTREISLDNIAYDNEQVVYLLRRLPLSEGYKATFAVFQVQSGSVLECKVEVAGKERVTVPAGTFDCYKTQLSLYYGTVKTREQTLWFSADKHLYLVKHDSGEAIMQLAEMPVKRGHKPQIIRNEELKFTVTIPADWHCYKSSSPFPYALSWQLLPPELEAWGMLAGIGQISLQEILPDINSRLIAEMDIQVLKGFFKNYTVRPDSWVETNINNVPAAQYVADYMDKEKAMIEYRTYLAGEPMLYWFVFRIEKEKFEANKVKFDSIVNNLELRRTSKVGEADKLASEDLAAEGWSLWRQRQLAEAEEKFKEAIKKDPTNESAYQGLGWAQFNQGKKLNAKDSFEKCIAINPNNAAALNGLGWIEHGQGNKGEAITWWEKAIAANPRATAPLSGLTQVYMERKQYDKAVKYYNMWLAVEPDNVQAKAGLEKAQAGAKDK